MESRTKSSAESSVISSSAAACDLRTLPPTPAVPPTEAPPTSTFLPDFSAPPETNTGTSMASRTQSSAASNSLVSSSGAACAMRTLPPAPANPPTEAPPTSTFLPDFSAPPETNTGTGSYGTMSASGTKQSGTKTASETGTQSMSSGGACALKSLPPAPENPPTEAPPTSSSELGTFSAAPETNTGTGFVSSTGNGGPQPSKTNDGSSMQTPAPTKSKSKDAPATTSPPGIGPLSDCSLVKTTMGGTIAPGPQTYCTCGHVIAGINTKSHDSTVYSICAGEPYPTIDSHTIDPPDPTPTVVKPVDPKSAPDCEPSPSGDYQDAHEDRMWAAVQDFCDQYNDNEPWHVDSVDEEYTWHDDELLQILDTNDSSDDVYQMSIKSVDHCDPGNGYNLHYPLDSTTCYLVLYDAWTKCKFAHLAPMQGLRSE
ncbi:MAG: hypothetical protein Q9222_005804 [Ikaeria aurantiellina]